MTKPGKTNPFRQLVLLLLLFFLIPCFTGRVKAQTDWNDASRLPPLPGSYRLTADVTTGSWAINGGSRSLDLNGHTVTITSSPGISVQMGGTLQINDSLGSGVIRFSGFDGLSDFNITYGTLILNSGTIEGYINLSPKGLGKIEANVSMYGGTIVGGVIFNNDAGAGSVGSSQISSNMVMSGGSITCTQGKPCVDMDNENAVFTLESGSLKAEGSIRTVNILSGAFHQSGGEISLVRQTQYGSDCIVLGDNSKAADKGSFLMTGGKISGFTGVSGYGTGNAIVLYKGGSVTMTGGEISGNNTGVSIGEGGSFTMTGGRVTGNTTGVYIQNNSAGFSVSGSPKITENSSSNVSFNGNKQKIKISTSGLNSDARIGVRSAADGSTPVTGVITLGLNGNYAPDIFTSDVSGFSVGMNADGEMIFDKTIRVRFYIDGSFNSEKLLPLFSLIKELPEVILEPDKILDGWYKKDDYQVKFDPENETVYDPMSYDMKLYGRIADVTAAIGETNYATLQEALSAANTGETVTLLRNVMLDAPLSLDKIVTLDLNGKTIDRGLTEPTENGYVIRVTAAHTLIIKDSSMAQTGRITGGNNKGNGGAILVDDRGTLVLESGSISGNSAAAGGGVYVSSDETMAEIVARGGEISGNTGGNLYLGSGKMIAIHQLPAEGTNIGVTLADGVGPFAESTGGYNGGKLTAADMRGFVSDNNIYAVGVKPDGKAYLGTPVTVTFNTADGTAQPDTISVSSGSYITKPALTIPDGKALAGWYKENTYTNKWNFNSDTVNTALTLYAKIEDSEPVAAIGSIKYSTVQEALDEAANGDTVTLLKDVYIDQELNLAAGKSVTLDMDENTITQNGSGRIFRIEGGLTLTGNGKLTGGAVTGEGGGAVYVSGGSFTMLSGTITNNSAYRGGAVYADNKAVIIMEGGTITGNSGNTGGGAVYLNIVGDDLNSGSTFTMKGGEISGNKTKTDGYGGAVYVNLSTFSMEGGTISDNTASYGGAVSLRSSSGYASFTMKDGTISGNSASPSGGAVYFYNDSNSDFIVEGGIITGNTVNDADNNVLVPRGKYLNVSDPLPAGTSVGISMQSPGVFGKGKSGALSFEPQDYFFSDDPKYAVGLNTYGEAILGDGFTVSFVTEPAGVITDPEAQTVFSGTKIKDPTLSVPDTYVFDGWYRDENFQNKWDFSADTVSENITLYAKLRTVWQWVQSELNAGKTSITLPGDAIAGSNDEPLTTKAGVGVTIDLYGHSIDRGLSGFEAVENGNVITANGNLTLTDSVGGGVITGGNTTGDGGGILVNAGDLTLYEVTVSGNRSGRDGGGIYVSENSGKFTLSRVSQSGPRIIGNTMGMDANNVYLPSGKIINVDMSFTGDRSIGVTMAVPGIFTSSLGYGRENSFFSDDPAYVVGMNGHRKAYLGMPRTVRFELDKNGTSAGDPDPREIIVADGSAISAQPTVRNIPDGYGVDGWYTDSTYQSKWNFLNNTVSGDMTLYARIMEAEASLMHTGTTTLYPTLQKAINAAGEVGVLRGDYVITLLKDISSVDSIDFYQKSAVLDLAGHTITGTGDKLGFAVIEVVSSALVLMDSSPGQTGMIIGGPDDTHGVYVSNSTFAVEGGTIKGCSGTTKGGGVYIAGKSNFMLSGGRIIGNAAGESGGGIYFDAKGVQSFTLNSGMLHDGGNGEISGNTNDSGSPSNVWLPQGMMISVTHALTGREGTIGITMEHPGVFARAAGTYNGGRLTEADAAVFFSDDPNYVVLLNENGEAELVRAYTVNFVIEETTAGTQKTAAGGKVKNPAIAIPKTRVLTGWYRESTFVTPWNFDTDTVNENMALYGKLEDAAAAIGETGYLTVQDAVNDAQTGETVTLLKDVTIGAPVEIAAGKTITMDLNGKTLDRGLSSETPAEGGSVITVNGSLTLTDSIGGGKVTGGHNSRQNEGGGVQVNSGGSFTMTGGSISGNSACLGGGIHVTDGEVSLEGGSISGNSALCGSGGTPAGGGVFFDSGNLSLKGTVQIKDNSEGNLYLAVGKQIALTTAPEEGASIGITLQSGIGVFAEGYGHTLSDKDKKYFFSDDPQYAVGLTPDHRLFLGRPCRVSFDANTTDDVTGTMEPQSFIEGEEQALTAHAFKRSGYGFDGWNTDPDGSGQAYDDGQRISVTGDITLYAQWVTAHTVTFISNDDEGSIKAEGTMHAERFNYGLTQTLTGNAFTRRGFFFTNWNTAADGSGEGYADKAVVTIEDDLTLYAQWKIISYSITYDLDGGALPEGRINPVGYTVETDDFTLVNPVRIGYRFGGWWDGTSSSQTVTIPWGSTGNRTYKVDAWTANQYTVRYEPNGGSGSMPEQSFVYDIEQALRKNVFTREGFVFLGWNTESDGSGHNYSDGEILLNLAAEDGAVVTLYAEWTQKPVHIITFSANNGSGMENHQNAEDSVPTRLSPSMFRYDGHEFIGWNTVPDGSGEFYADETEITLTEDLTLYAQWRMNEPKRLEDGTISLILDPQVIDYDGQEHEVRYKVFDAELGEYLTEGVDYELDDSRSTLRAVEPGTYEVWVTADNKTAKSVTGAAYSGTRSAEWKIVKRGGGEDDGGGIEFFPIQCEDCVLPNTGFSSLKQSASSGSPHKLAAGTLGMDLMIPKLELTVELAGLPKTGNSWPAEWLGSFGGVLEGSALPGEGYSLIAAHNTLNETEYGPFARLYSLEANDVLFIRTGSGELRSFRVYANELIAPDDFDTLRRIAEQEPGSLILLTCENESLSGGYLDRRVVFAK